MKTSQRINTKFTLRLPLVFPMKTSQIVKNANLCQFTRKLWLVVNIENVEHPVYLKVFPGFFFFTYKRERERERGGWGGREGERGRERRGGVEREGGRE